MRSQPLRTVLPGNSRYVYQHEDGQWYCTGASFTGGLRTLLANDVTDSITWGMTYHLIFQDQDAIDAFLTDDDPALEQIRWFVTLVRTYQGYMVLTASELKATVSRGATLTEGPSGTWLEKLLSSHAKPHEESSVQYKPPSFWQPTVRWSMNGIVNEEHFTWCFTRFLQYHQAVEAISLGRPQTLLEGRRVIVEAGKDLTEFGVDNFANGLALVVPDQSNIPPLMAELRAGWSEQSGATGWFPKQAATLYMLDVPPLPPQRWVRQDLVALHRLPPLDVLAATQYSS